jgi:recombination associated protein RdgC
MGILANTVSICHFQVMGDLPPGDLFPWAADCLAKHAFQPIDATLDEQATGWVHLDNHQATDFAAPAAFWRDHYLTFTLRRDQRKIPAALLKAYYQVAEHEYLSANPGLSRVPKQKREELRDAVRLQLLARTLPAPAAFDAVWDTRSGLVTFTSLSPKVIDLFETHFKKSFPGLRLVAIPPFSRAGRVLADEQQPLLARANQATSESILDLIKANQWLGWDFLLWLLHRTMQESGEYRVSRPGPLAAEPFVAFLNDRVCLQSVSETGTQKITVAGAQDNFQEVLSALKLGKRITEATLFLEKDENSWKLTLKGELFHFASFKAPAVQIEKGDNVDADSEREAVFFERMHLLESGLQLFDSLYAQFLADRLGDTWPAAEQRITAWLAGE